MLGRLRMPLDKAILSFEQLMKDVFSEKKRVGDGAFKLTNLGDAILKIVEEATGNPNERMLDSASDETACKTMVFAMSKQMTAELPTIFRSYPTDSNPGPDCEIWKALCATMALPGLFKGVEIGEFKQLFLDAGVKCSNPLAHVLSEVRKIHPDNYVASVVSIGAGHARTIEIPKSEGSFIRNFLPINAISATKNFATDSERVANEMESRFSEIQGVYFRLNVDQGLQSVKLSEWEDLDKVAAHTHAYIRTPETRTRIYKAGRAVRLRESVIKTAAIDGHVMTQPGAICRVKIKRPPAPTAIFTGRGDEIDRILKCSISNTPERRVCVVHGLGGSGKTQVVLKAIEKEEERWPMIVYVDSSTPPSIESSLGEFALGKGIGETHKDAITWLGCQREQWLLVFDGADMPNQGLTQYFPKGGHGSIIVTTRWRCFARYATGPGYALDVTRMEQEEALELLMRVACRNQQPIASDQLKAATELLQEFEYFALAIVQAGAYVDHTNSSFSRYKELFLSRKKETLERFTKLPKLDDYSETVYTTWIMCYEQLGSDAQQVLGILGYLHHNGITKSLFQRAALGLQVNPWYISTDGQTPLSHEEKTALDFIKQFLLKFAPNREWDSFEFSERMGEISSLSLIEPDEANESYSIHLLVQDWARTIAPTSDVSALQCAAALLALSVQPDDNNDVGEQIFRRGLDLHVDRVDSEISKKRGSLGVHHAAAFSEIYYDKGLFEKSKHMRLQALEKERACLGEAHPVTLRTMSHLATTYWEVRQFEEAAELQRKVYDICLKTCGPTHPRTLDAKVKLVSTYSSMGHTKESNELLDEILEDPSNLQRNPSILGELAQFCYNRFDYPNAEKIDLFYIGVLEMSLGEEHPQTLGAMSNLASTYARLGRFDAAETWDRRALEIQKRVLGDKHPETLRTMENLASTYANLSRFSEAEELSLEVLNSRKRIHGEKHVRTLTIALSLLNIYKWWRKEKEAEEMSEEVNRLEILAGPVITKEAHREFQADFTETLSTQLRACTTQ
ncbi:unnamed protein product [Rhizoctonia solani]|uniref:PNPLA domain-containing protein n=1 Tax=Rhizoctonia solani TaxID=456999 RepID=A0A8H3AS56_9AGAM|nr:unnamed protein product [Rhizoctonia solani]